MSKKLLFVMFLLLLPGCINHPAYWSEESCEYCIKQNEHYIRVHKDEMIKGRLRRLEKSVGEIKVLLSYDKK